MTEESAKLEGPDNNWLLISRGYYWRPGSMGYTAVRAEAGRYHKTEAEAVAAMVAGTTAIHESDAPMYAPGHQRECWALVTTEKVVEVPREPTDEILTAMGIASLSRGGKENIDWWCITDEARAVISERLRFAYAALVEMTEKGQR